MLYVTVSCDVRSNGRTQYDRPSGPTPPATHDDVR